MQELALEAVAARRARTPGRRATGWPIASRCARIWCVRPVSSVTRSSVSSGSARSISKCVTACLGSSVSVEIRVRVRRSRPSGASIVPARAGGRPSTSARYSRRDLARPQRGLQRRGAPPRPRATTSSPEVSRSRRWTMPGAAGPPRRGAPGERLRERARAVPARRGGRPRPPACRPRAGARPRRRPERRAGALGARRRRGSASSTHHARPRRARGAWAAARRRRAPRPASISRCAAAREPERPARNDVEALARGLRPERRQPASSARLEDVERATSTPNVMAMSATLNAGQCGNLMKSVTAPSACGRSGCRPRRRAAARSAARPAAACRWREEEREQRADAMTAIDHARSRRRRRTC